MTIRSAEEAKKIIRHYEGAAILTKVPNLEDFDTYSRAKAYLSALRGPEVSALVEAVKNATDYLYPTLYRWNSLKEKLQSALTKIEEVRK